MRVGIASGSQPPSQGNYLVGFAAVIETLRGKCDYRLCGDLYAAFCDVADWAYLRNGPSWSDVRPEMVKLARLLGTFTEKMGEYTFPGCDGAPTKHQAFMLAAQEARLQSDIFNWDQPDFERALEVISALREGAERCRAQQSEAAKTAGRSTNEEIHRLVIKISSAFARHGKPVPKISTYTAVNAPDLSEVGKRNSAFWSSALDLMDSMCGTKDMWSASRQAALEAIYIRLPTGQ